MPRSKQDQRIAMEQSNKMSMEPILQDFSITSLSEMSSEVHPPSDSSLFEKVINYDVALPDMTLNETNDVNFSSDQYPPDTTMMDITKMNSPKPMFKKPFISRSKRKARPSIFEKDIQDSENDTPEAKIRKPFRKKVKVAINEIEFENVFISSNESTHTLSNVDSNLIRRRRKRVKKNINNSLFDKDLNSSESDKSFSLRRTLLRRKVNAKKITAAEFDEILDNTLNASQADESQHKIPFRNRLKSIQNNFESTLFESDLNSSNSFKDNSRVLTSEDKKREAGRILNENKTNCSINNLDNIHKNSPVISEPKRLTSQSLSKQNNVESDVFENDLDSSNSLQLINEPQSKKLPFKSILQHQKKIVEMGLFDNDLNSSESFQDSTLRFEDKKGDSSQILDENINNCALNNLDKIDKDFSVISEFDKSTPLSPSAQTNVELDSVGSDCNSSFSLQLSSSLATSKENGNGWENILYDTKQYSNSNTMTESGSGHSCSTDNHEVEKSSSTLLNSETTNVLSNCQRTEHSQEIHDLSEVQSNNSPEGNNLEAVESNINSNKSVIEKTNCSSFEKPKDNNLFKKVPDTQNEKSLLNIEDPVCDIAVGKNDSQNNEITVLDEVDKSERNNSLEHNENHKTVTSEFNLLLPNDTTSKLNSLDVSNNINELVVQCNEHPENCAVNTSLPKERQECIVGSNNHTDSSYINRTDKLTKSTNVECESPLKEILENKKAYLTRKSVRDKSNSFSFMINSLGSENSGKTRSVMKSAVDISNCIEEQSKSTFEQPEFSLFAEQSSKSRTSISAFIDIHASKCTNSSVNLTSSNQGCKSISARDTSAISGDVSSSVEKEHLLENNDQTSAEEDEFTERSDEEEEKEDEIAEEQLSTTGDINDEETEDDCNVEASKSSSDVIQEVHEDMQDKASESVEEVNETGFEYEQNESEQNIRKTPQRHLGSSAQNVDNSLPVNNLTHQECSFKVPNKPLRKKHVSKKPLPIPLNKTKVQEILDNMPYSELKRKKQKSVDKTKPTQLNFSNDNGKARRNACIIPTRLKKPQKWITTKFYQFIIEKLTPRFHIRSRVKAEQVVISLVDYVKRIMNENSHFYEIVEEMKNDLAELEIIKTHLDFHEFVHNYFDGRFVNKLFPLHDDDNWNPFEPDDLSESIL